MYGHIIHVLRLLQKLPGYQRACRLCLKSRVGHARESPSDIDPASKLHWHFACSFDFRHSLNCHVRPYYTSIIVFVGTSRLLKGLKIMSKIKGRTRPTCLPRSILPLNFTDYWHVTCGFNFRNRSFLREFPGCERACRLYLNSKTWRVPRLPLLILPVSFTDTLLVVSILDIDSSCSTFQTVNPTQDGEGGKKAPSTNFSPVISTDIRSSSQTFLTFSLNPFATMV